MFRKLLVCLFGFLVFLPIFGAVAGIKFLQISKLMAMGQPPEPVVAVSVGQVRAESWESRVPSVGSVVAVQGVTVSAESEGTIREILFEAGAVVKAGDVLVRLDTDVEQAQLRAAEAAADWARVSLERSRDLFASKTVSKAELDSAEANLKQTAAQADNVRAVIAKKNITAPFAGRLGIREISVGQFLNKGSAVVSLQALESVYVEFSLPQQWLGALNEGLLVRALTDAFPGNAFEGKLSAINPDVDPVTRNVRMQATFSNADGKLHPGMYVTVDLVLPKAEKVLVIPATAVVYAPYGSTVFAAVDGEAGADGKKPLVAELRTVRLGQRRGDFVVVTIGLKEGERVVTNGGLKLKPGSHLAESTLGVTSPELAPKPPNT